MQGKSADSQSSRLMALASANFDASRFGNTVGEQLHAIAVAAAGSSTTTAAPMVGNHGGIPRTSDEPTGRPTSSALSNGARPGVPLSRQARYSPIAATPSESSPASSRPGPQSSSYPLTAASSTGVGAANAPVSPLRTSTLKQNGRERQSKSSQQQRRTKRVLPPMMPPLQQPPPQSKTVYHFGDSNSNNNNNSTSTSSNNNLSSQVDLTSSYTTTSYASDSAYKSNNNSIIKVSANSSSLSSLDPYAKSSSGAAPFWCGLRPTESTKSVPGKVVPSKRLKTPPSSRATMTHKVDIGGGIDRQQQHQKTKHTGCGGVNDELDLSASPWDTYDDLDDGFGSDFLLGQDWQAFSLAEPPPHEEEGGDGSTKSPEKQQRKQKSKQSDSGFELKSCGDGAPSLTVTSLGSSQQQQQLQHSFSVPKTTGNNRILSTARGESSSEMATPASSSALSAPSGNKVHPDHHVQLRNQFVLLGAVRAGLFSEVEQLQGTKSPLHPQSQQQQLPRNASREKDFVGWNESPGLPNDNALVLRGERKSKPSLPSSHSPDSDGRPGSDSRPLSPIRASNGGGGCGCSRSETRPNCSFEHCGAAAQLSLPYGDDGGESNERPKSPVFKMERHVGTLDDKPEGESLHHRTREVMDDVTILLNANREITLRPTKQASKLAELTAMYAPPTRSQMIKRRYKYTFGKT